MNHVKLVNDRLAGEAPTRVAGSLPASSPAPGPVHAQLARAGFCPLAEFRFPKGCNAELVRKLLRVRGRLLLLNETAAGIANLRGVDGKWPCPTASQKHTYRGAGAAVLIAPMNIAF